MCRTSDKMCRTSGCKIIPVFNIEGEKALFCFSHKLEGMVDVYNKRCNKPGCERQPTYNLKGQKKALFCLEHKEEGMVDVKNKTCNKPGCERRSTYNLKGQTKALFCSEHKEEGMVDVNNKRCNKPGCERRPICNLKGQKPPLFCSEHKEEGMVDVSYKRCNKPGCEKRPNYNLKGQTKALFCSEHKEEGMVFVKYRRCIKPGCEKHRLFNLKGQTKALFCSEHKEEDMVDVRNKTCNNEWCPIYVHDNKYEGYCLRCFMHMFPDKPVTRNYKTKEFAVVEHIQNKYPDFTWIADKTVQDGCSKRRPDLLLDLGYQIIILEVDENQHIDYDCSCENKRIMQLSQDLGHRPIIFIRFNPDDYDDQGENITSCWGTNKQGICVVLKKDEWTQRLTALETQIDYWAKPENKTDKIIEIVQLFYDI